MQFHLVPGIAGVLFLTGGLLAQSPPAAGTPVPIYRVNVVERTIQAVNYQYRSEPTKIDFKGTVLLPMAKGQAVVESKRGRTVVDAKFEHLEPPSRFGPEYLSYVLWAITPQGHATNLGEVIADGSNHAHLRVTTELQAFGLLLTAEPYGSVHQPSDVVVAQNFIRPDTVGEVVPVQAKYELMPRGHYTYNVPANMQEASANTQKLPQRRYEAVLELYEAQNAVQIAQTMDAGRYAADTLAKAQSLLSDAQRMEAQKAEPEQIVTVARAASEAAEDARVIAEKRRADEEVARMQDQVEKREKEVARAQADLQQTRSELLSSREQLDQERAARERAEQEAMAARQRLQGEAARMSVAPSQPQQAEVQRKDVRIRLRGQLNAILPTLDSPRGLVTTVPDLDFRGAALQSVAVGELYRMAGIILSHPGLRAEVDGYTDTSGSAEHDLQFAQARADAVRDVLMRAGVSASAILVRSFGKDRPLVSNDTAEHRRQNRRVEIVFSGDPIGTLPSWENAYRLRSY